MMPPPAPAIPTMMTMTRTCRIGPTGWLGVVPAASWTVGGTITGPGDVAQGLVLGVGVRLGVGATVGGAVAVKGVPVTVHVRVTDGVRAALGVGVQVGVAARLLPVPPLGVPELAGLFGVADGCVPPDPPFEFPFPLPPELPPVLVLLLADDDAELLGVGVAVEVGPLAAIWRICATAALACACRLVVSGR
jgi:hypothetical protein